MEVFNNFLDIIKTWNSLGQALFFLAVLIMPFSFTIALVRYFVILCRGWPPAIDNEEE